MGQRLVRGLIETVDNLKWLLPFGSAAAAFGLWQQLETEVTVYDETTSVNCGSILSPENAGHLWCQEVGHGTEIWLSVLFGAIIVAGIAGYFLIGAGARAWERRHPERALTYDDIDPV